jgi:hypothetical protein
LRVDIHGGEEEGGEEKDKGGKRKKGAKKKPTEKSDFILAMFVLFLAMTDFRSFVDGFVVWGTREPSRLLIVLVSACLSILPSRHSLCLSLTHTFLLNYDG